MNKKRIFKILALIQIIALFIVSSYSWFIDKSNPTISESSMRVASADGLVLKLQPDSEARLEVGLNEIIDHYSEFELKQISSADAQNFYFIDFGQGLSQGDPQFVKAIPLYDEVYNMNTYGFISYDFYLQTENFAKHVYLHKDTAITGTAASSIRIALSITQGETTNIIILGLNEEDGDTNPYTTEAIIKEGVFDFYDIDPTFISDQNVKLISSKDGGRGTSDDDPIDFEKVLVNMQANTQIKVNVKIWLEGGDIDCDSSISSSEIDLLIKFGSANILLEAPNVTPNNTNYTINNLTTDMEYASTNTPSTVWTPVTDASMTFSAQEIVYVRIAEVPNVSPASYAKMVEFD